MSFVVFYRFKDKSVSLFANNGTDEDVENFNKMVLEELRVTGSNSSSASCSGSPETSVYPFAGNVLVSRIVTNARNMGLFERLLKKLSETYLMYED